MTTVAALYVLPDGIYANRPDVEVWDEARDARKYAGPWPVVAHPPCNLWVNLARVNFKRWGGEHNRPGNDNGCFDAALTSVRKWGGVLEHPAGSWAWSSRGLLRPIAHGWSFCGGREWVCEVWQSAYGHKARKRTWLLYCGDNPPPSLFWERKPGTHQCGKFDRNKPTIAGKRASATPPAFAELLLSMARSARRAELDNLSPAAGRTIAVAGVADDETAAGGGRAISEVDG